MQKSVLWVEDTEGDRLLISQALEQLNRSQPFMVTNGEEALRVLKSPGDRFENGLPSLIVLDLNLPGKNGDEILEEIKSEPRFKNIQVAMFSTSDDKRYIERCSDLGACRYFVKPVEVEDFFRVVGEIVELWMEIRRTHPTGN